MCNHTKETNNKIISAFNKISNSDICVCDKCGKFASIREANRYLRIAKRIKNDGLPSF